MKEKFEKIFIGIIVGVILSCLFLGYYQKSLKECEYDPNPDKCLDYMLWGIW